MQKVREMWSNLTSNWTSILSKISIRAERKVKGIRGIKVELKVRGQQQRLVHDLKGQRKASQNKRVKEMVVQEAEETLKVSALLMIKNQLLEKTRLIRMTINHKKVKSLSKMMTNLLENHLKEANLTKARAN